MPRTSAKRKRTSGERSDSDAPLSDVENLRDVVIPVNNQQASQPEDMLTATQTIIDTSANTVWSQATHRLFANTAEDFHLKASLQQLLEQYLISWCNDWCQEQEIATDGSTEVDIPFHVIMTTALQLSTHDITQGLRLRLNSVETDVRHIKKDTSSLGLGATLTHNQERVAAIAYLFFFTANCPGYSVDSKAIYNAVMGHLRDHPENVHDSRGALWFDPSHYHMFRILQKGVRTAIQDLRGNIKHILFTSLGDLEEADITRRDGWSLEQLVIRLLKDRIQVSHAKIVRIAALRYWALTIPVRTRVEEANGAVVYESNEDFWTDVDEKVRKLNKKLRSKNEGRKKEANMVYAQILEADLKNYGGDREWERALAQVDVDPAGDNLERRFTARA